MRIYVAGHRGLVGSALVREIEKHPEHTWIGKSRSELDLLDRKAVFDFLASEKPDAVIIAAAKVGGIMANSTYPVEFLSENLQIETNLIDGAHAAGIDKLLFLGSSCIYPKLAPQPIKEEYLLTGPLEQTNEPYALAKISGLKLVQAYRKEYQRRWISVMPTNIYGSGDNFDEKTSHVLPALIGKLHTAMKAGSRSVIIWGSGTPKREFMYSEDLASACIFLLENYNDDSHINVGTGTDLSISELAQTIAKVVGFEGEIQFDTSKPDGTPRKLLDVTRINSLGWSSSMPLNQGIELTYRWYLENVDKPL
jgi:GDP-L-fucose synthase